jgi:hypothetical protein
LIFVVLEVDSVEWKLGNYSNFFIKNELSKPFI